MKMIGVYDAYDKWEMLCRHWDDPASVTEAVVDKWGTPAFGEWESLAVAGGHSACVEYMDAKLGGLGIDRASVPFRNAIDLEIAELAGTLGSNALLGIVRSVGPALARSGFRAPLDSQLSDRLGDRLRDVFKTGAINLLQWSDGLAEVPDVDLVRIRKNHFPYSVLRHRNRILSLFSALNYGRSDVIHVYDAHPDHVTLVDIDRKCIEDMQLIYPRNWTYICSDFYDFLKNAQDREEHYDLIIADPYLPLAPRVALDCLPTVMALCSDTFITNYTLDMFTELDAKPDDPGALSRAIRDRTGVPVTVAEIMPRNASVFWVVMQKA